MQFMEILWLVVALSCAFICPIAILSLHRRTMSRLSGALAVGFSAALGFMTTMFFFFDVDYDIVWLVPFALSYFPALVISAILDAAYSRGFERQL